jgi:cytochrome c peroxidase
MILLVVLAACDPPAKDDDTAAVPTWGLPLPAGFPEPNVPADNPATPEKFELGRHLFYDTRLSGNETQACSDCHDPTIAFADGEVTPVGSTGDIVPRNSMALVNVAWNATYTWPNPALTSLEEQILVPMFAEFPTELGLTGKEADALARIEADPLYDPLFAAAFPDDDAPVSVENVVYGLATFVRGLTGASAPYDRYAAGDTAAMTAEARRGMALFFGETTECYHCHAGPTFSASFVSASAPTTELAFFNTGLYNIGGTGAYPPENPGLYATTGDPEDMGRFRSPTLRNLRWTAPYMHDGSIATLVDVLEHYNDGGRTIAKGDYAGVGADNPYKHPLVKPLALTDTEKAELLAFLDALNDEEFVANAAYVDPFEE